MIGEMQEQNAARVMPDPNLAYLDAELRLLRLRLEALVRGAKSAEQAMPSLEEQDEAEEIKVFVDRLRAEATAQRWRLHLDDVVGSFQLNEFERHILLLAAAPDLDEGFGAMIAQAQGSGATWPTVGLAWRLFCPSLQECIDSRDSFRDDAPLFRFRLLELTGIGLPLPERILHADRRIVDTMVARMMPDARIAPHVRLWSPRKGEAAVSPSESDSAELLAKRIREFLQGGKRSGAQLIFNLFGTSCTDLEELAALACNRAGLPLMVADVGSIAAQDIPIFLRESLLLSCALFVSRLEWEAPGGSEWPRRLADSGPILFLGSEHALRAPEELHSAIWLPVAVPRPDVWRRAEIWERWLRYTGIDHNGAIASLSDHFAFSATEIQRTAREAANLAWLQGEVPEIRHVFAACRREVQHHMHELAQQLRTLSSWEDLLLPEEAMAKLRELCAQVRVHHVVLDRYGFGARLSRGRGITALFAGPSGTGKTMAAEVIARDLGRALFRVDLARVVSKYIGETEKNLRQTFTEAERARCVLLFDEADALFGRRTEVRDSHDRYANIEVSYLLQLMEETEAAVVLLATNRRDAIDEAFLRRFRFLVDFPLPTPDVRRKLWANSFPPEVVTRGVQLDVLADRLPLTGASIKNIALAATYLAASDGGVVGPQQIAHAARRELERMGRPAPFTEADLCARTHAKGQSN